MVMKFAHRLRETVTKRRRLMVRWMRHGLFHRRQDRQQGASAYRVGLRAQANFSTPTFEPAHEARAGQRAALSV